MLTGFEKYNKEMHKFEESQLFRRCFTSLIFYLTRHADKWFKSKELEGRYNIRGSELRKLIQHARRQSVPIASSSKGYQMAMNFSEIQSTIAHLKERARENFFTASKLGKTYPDERQMGMQGVA